ncbi:MAG TPA: response regulator, partial [Ktedonobacteraceae bacterium]
FSRVEAGRIQASYEATDLSRYTADLVSNFRSVVEQAGMQLLVSASPLSEPVYVDQDMWEKIVFNLLSNAFKFTLDGSIEVALTEEKEHVVFSVRDSGVGISQEDLPHIFERFQRVEGSKARSFEGSGIGLSLVQELVKLHKGSIEVQSAPGLGTTFAVTLLKGSAHLPKEQVGARRTLQSNALGASFYVQEALQWLPTGALSAPDLPDTLGLAGADFRQTLPVFADCPRIVVADDNADMRGYLQQLLQDLFEVKAVSNGQAALEAVRQQRTDLVLTDVMMPGMDGFQLLQALKADQETSRIPVLLVSARAGEEATVEGMQAGADDYVVKPFSARELLARVTTHIKIARSRHEAEQRLYDLFMQAPAAVVILRGPTFQVELANPIALKIWGRTSEDVLHKPFFEALSEVRGQGLEPLLEGVLTTGVPYYGDELKISLDRAGNGILEDVYFMFVYTPLRSAIGTIEGVMVFAYEVTERVLARQRLEESEARFRALADNVPNLVWTARPDGWVYWYNTRWYDYTGTTPEQMEGWGWQSVHDPQVLPMVLEQWEKSLTSKVPFEMVFPLRGADGLFRPFLTRMVPIYDDAERLLHWFGTSTDITEQKRLEQLKDEFIGVASHELRTPLTSLKAY